MMDDERRGECSCSSLCVVGSIVITRRGGECVCVSRSAGRLRVVTVISCDVRRRTRISHLLTSRGPKKIRISKKEGKSLGVPTSVLDEEWLTSHQFSHTHGGSLFCFVLMLLLLLLLLCLPVSS